MTPSDPHDMMEAASASMAERTGRTVEEWVAVVKTSGLDPLDQAGVRRWLRTEHGMPQNSQWIVADAAARAAGWVRPTVDEYINQQYTGPKERLRPILDRLREIIESFGDDVRVEGRATYTPFVRRRQFVAVAAATRARIDVGCRYVAPPTSDLLSPAKAPGQATHRFSVTSVDGITSEVERLLRAAYDQNG